MTLTEFLLARIAEDEENAHRKAGKLLALNSPERPVHLSDSPFSVARVLAECDAKRQIVERCSGAIESGSDDAGPLTSGAHLGTDTLTHLAAVYADHPDYREEWRP